MWKVLGTMEGKFAVVGSGLVLTRKFCATAEMTHPYSLDVFNSRVYWSSQVQGKIFYQRIAGDTEPHQVVEGLQQPTGVKLLHSMKQKTGRNKRALGW